MRSRDRILALPVSHARSKRAIAKAGYPVKGLEYKGIFLDRASLQWPIYSRVYYCPSLHEYLDVLEWTDPSPGEESVYACSEGYISKIMAPVDPLEQYAIELEVSRRR